MQTVDLEDSSSMHHVVSHEACFHFFYFHVFIFFFLNLVVDI